MSKRSARILLVILVVLLTLSLASCWGDGGGNIDQPATETMAAQSTADHGARIFYVQLTAMAQKTPTPRKGISP